MKWIIMTTIMWNRMNLISNLIWTKPLTKQIHQKIWIKWMFIYLLPGAPMNIAIYILNAGIKLAWGWLPCCIIWQVPCCTSRWLTVKCLLVKKVFFKFKAGSLICVLMYVDGFFQRLHCRTPIPQLVLIRGCKIT